MSKANEHALQNDMIHQRVPLLNTVLRPRQLKAADELANIYNFLINL